MTRMQRQLFEAGRHRGHDPLGYRSVRDAAGHLVHPRQLEIVPEEAAIVRRVWHELATRSIAEVADLLNREGVPHRGAWTRDGVKDILRRGRMYLGFVIEKRGRDERPGQHEPILSEASTARRWRPSRRAPEWVTSRPLSATTGCELWRPARAPPGCPGEAHVQRGTEIRYYRCPTLGCRARRAPAELVEGEVLTAIAQASCRARSSTPRGPSCGGGSRSRRSPSRTVSAPGS